MTDYIQNESILPKKIMKSNMKRQSILIIFSVCYIISTTGNALPGAPGLEIHSYFANSKLKLNGKISLALDLALTKYSDQQIWIIYAIDSDPYLERMFLSWQRAEPLIIPQSLIRQQSGYDKETSLLEAIRQSQGASPGSLSPAQQHRDGGVSLEKAGQFIPLKLAVVLDYSLEFGQPRLRQVVLQLLDQPFWSPARPIFWLGTWLLTTATDRCYAFKKKL